MSQIFSDRLSIDQIAQKWAAETEKAGFGAEHIAEDMVKAAELGEFEHPTHSREDAPLGEYTYKKDWIDPKKSKTLKGEQPGVGPYRSALTMGGGQSVNTIDIQNYLKARQTAPGATDRETRRIVASEIFLYVEGLRRWCDEPGFAEWAKLRGLSRPKFIRSIASKEPPAATTAGAETRCKAWLTGLMEADPPKKRKPAYQEEAKTLFNVGSRAFSRAWADAVAETDNKDWSRPGPRS